MLIPNISLATTTSQTDFPTGTCSIPDGLLVYNTNNGITGVGAGGTGYYYWSTSVSRWINLVDNLAPGSPWMLLGNTGISAPGSPASYGTSNFAAADNWIGTTDANPLTFGTNNIERMRILSSGYIGIGTATPTSPLQLTDGAGGLAGGTLLAVNGSSITNGILASFTSSQAAGTVFSVTGSSLTTTGALASFIGTTQTGNLFTVTGNSLTSGNGINLSSNSLTSGYLLSVNASNATNNVAYTGSAIYANNSAPYGSLFTGVSSGTTSNLFTITANSLTSGRGFYISSTSLTTGNLVEIDAGSAGTSGNAMYISDFNPTGNAIWATGSEDAGVSTVFVNETATENGTNGVAPFDITETNHALAGEINPTASNYEYSFGVIGEVATHPGDPCGGVLGVYYATPTWGALGYRNKAASNFYGVYYYSTAGGGLGNGGGYMPQDNVIAGIGSGGYGGIIGSWTRGEVMGSISCGELFASYSLGNSYTSGYSAEIVTTETKRVPAYTVTSTDIKVYNDGTGKLTSGKSHVSFDTAFMQLIGENKPVVTVTPMGQCNGVYITNVTSTGFDVVELSNGSSDVEFSYIVVGKRIDAAGKPELPDALKQKNFDDNMKAVMDNENNKDEYSIPVWWDGTKVRFDALPANIESRALPANITQPKK